MIAFFNSIFGEFYKKIGLDLNDIATISSHFTGEVAGGMSFNDTGVDIEMIAVLNRTNKSEPEFLASVYLPWMMDYGRKMAAFYNQQTPGNPVKNIFSKTPESTVLGHKVFGVNCEIPIIMPNSAVSNKIKFNLRTTEVNELLLTASSDERLKKLIEVAGTLEKQPYDGPLMKIDINLGTYLGAVQKMVSQAGSGIELNLSEMGSLNYTLDIAKRKLSNKYVIRIDDIKSMISAFKQASGDSTVAETDSLYTADPSFSQLAPTILQHSGKEQMTNPKKEDPAEFWLDKGLLYATYGNDKEAIKFFKQSLQINPNNPRALFNMGLSYSSMGNYDMAVTTLNQALSMAPDNGDYHYGLGWVYLLKGESGKAMEYIRIAADLGNPDARQYLLKNK
jgi:tetratricopeptide (TPR) repeat protein